MKIKTFNNFGKNWALKKILKYKARLFDLVTVSVWPKVPGSAPIFQIVRSLNGIQTRDWISMKMKNTFFKK